MTVEVIALNPIKKYLLKVDKYLKSLMFDAFKKWLAKIIKCRFF
jgi:hypothetical protein